MPASPTCITIATMPPPPHAPLEFIRPHTIVFAFLDLADGGAQRLTLGHCRYIDRTRFRPEILCARGSGALVETARSDNLPVHILGRLHRPYDVAAVPIIAARLRSLSPTIVHVPLYSRAAPYIRLAARLARVPLVVAHEWSRAQPPSSARRMADRLLRPVTRFVAVSEHHARMLIDDGVPPAHIRVVIDGIDTQVFRPRDRDAARRRLNLPIDRPIVLLPARLHPAKGHADLVAALPTILDKIPDLLVLCAGDGPLRVHLTTFVTEAGLAAHLRFLGSRDDMPDLMAAADVVALASHIEGLPSVLLEAFSSGRPVVATDVGGVSEALLDGEAGRLVPPSAPKALADALLDVLGDSAVREAMGVRGRALALERYRAQDATSRLEAAYEAWL